MFYMFYHCSICDFVVDTACAKNPPPNVIEYPKAHEHSLVIAKDLSDFKCGFCGEEDHLRYRYRCYLCRLEFEIRCSMLALEIDYPYHPKHPLKFLTKEEHHFSDGKCRICGKYLSWKFYHCSICKFSVDVDCVRDPPPLAILFPKAHEHQLSLTPRKISFDCDACGMAGHRSPYSCQQCDFMIHQSCIDLPEIINVNRHEHCLSRCLHLSPGSWICGFCHKKVDWSYGAYSCSICPNYAIHSKCAIRDDVWDKLELKGIPEEPQDMEPFKEEKKTHNIRVPMAINEALVRLGRKETDYKLRIDSPSSRVSLNLSIPLMTKAFPHFSFLFSAYTPLDSSLIPSETCFQLQAQSRCNY
ncbi:hypothetical protein DY000_02037046 [Brassica cretica]|uniref:DC1 domain-containing protein n=1 Tax=Brassica cretica TaxID=69181 RepID=A0ABQ7BDU8_BRACR|nr:hypothetical protein DY000_02037046 [Brassica cretica]